MKIETGEQLLEAMRDYQIPCILAAAADLGVFENLVATPDSSDALAERLHCDLRAVTILLDALTAIGILSKEAGQYRVPDRLAPFVQENSEQSILPMLRHQATCLRRWARLPWTVQGGTPAAPGPSVRGDAADHASFIEAMHVVSREVAGPLVREICPDKVRCVLDLGGATGSWTLAWLDAAPEATAILFDLPDVLPLAQRRIATSPHADRVRLVAGDFYTDPLPTGADLVWVSAIIHQNSREQNRALFQRIAAAVAPGGRVYIRDIVMAPDHTRPPAGALFAVNMLTATQAGNTYALAEVRQDLETASFTDVELVRQHEAMHSVVRARAPHA